MRSIIVSAYSLVVAMSLTIESQLMVVHAEDVAPDFKTQQLHDQYVKNDDGQTRFKSVRDLLIEGKYAEARKVMDDWEAAHPKDLSSIQTLRKATDSAEKEPDMNKRKFRLVSTFMDIDLPSE